MSPKKISVIIPVYNVEQFIQDCLESLASQTYKEFEVIFVDDCGTDRSMQIISSFLCKGLLQDPHIVKRETNGGLSAARNTGIQNAKGDYLLFLDSDDKLMVDAIETFNTSITNNDYDVVISNYKKIPTGDECSNRIGRGDLSGNEIAQSYYNNKMIVTAWNKLVKKEFIINNKLYFEEGIIHEDVLWSFLIMSKAQSLNCIDEITYLYRLRPDSIMTKKFGHKNIKSLQRILEVISSRHDILNDRKALQFYYKKCLEQGLKVYAMTDRKTFDDFVQSISTYPVKKWHFSSSFLAYAFIRYTPSGLSNLMMEFFLNSKFKYLKKV